MKGFKYSTSGNGLKQRQFCHAPQQRSPAVQHLSSSTKRLTNKESMVGLSGQTNLLSIQTTGGGSTRQLSQKSLTRGKQSQRLNTLLRNINQRQIDDPSPSPAERLQLNKELASMQVASFMQPTQGVGVGCSRADKSRLHQRTFVRNLGIEVNYGEGAPQMHHQLLGGSQTSSFPSTRPMSVHAPTTVKGPIVSTSSVGALADFEDDHDSQPIIQGQRYAMQSQNRSRQEPYFSKNILYKRMSQTRGGFQLAHQNLKLQQGQISSMQSDERVDTKGKEQIELTTAQQQDTISPMGSSSADQDVTVSPKSPKIFNTTPLVHVEYQEANAWNGFDGQLLICPGEKALGRSAEVELENEAELQQPPLDKLPLQKRTRNSGVNTKDFNKLQMTSSSMQTQKQMNTMSYAEISGAKKSEIDKESRAIISSSKQTTPMCNVTPRAQPEELLKAKYSPFSKMIVRTGPVSELTPSQLNSYGNVQPQQRQEQEPEQQTPRTKIKLRQQQQQEGVRQSRCMTPPCNVEHRTRDVQNEFKPDLQIPQSERGDALHEMGSTARQKGPIQKGQESRRRSIYSMDPGIITKNDDDLQAADQKELSQVINLQSTAPMKGSSMIDVRAQVAPQVFANTEGNVNISAILVQAAHNQSSLQLKQKAQMMQQRQSIDTGFDQKAETYSCYEQGLIQPYTTTTAQRLSVGINFQKPVSKLVSNVAKAIGESVRKMEPRSLQRGSIENLNSRSTVTKQKQRLGQARQAKSSYGTRQQRSLIDKIARIAQQSTTEINENEMLELSLRNLVMEQQQLRQYASQKTNMSSQSTPSILQPVTNFGKHLICTTTNNDDLLLAIQSNQYNVQKEPVPTTSTSKTEILLQRGKSPYKTVAGGGCTANQSPLDKSLAEKSYAHIDQVQYSISPMKQLYPEPLMVSKKPIINQVVSGGGGFQAKRASAVQVQQLNSGQHQLKQAVTLGSQPSLAGLKGWQQSTQTADLGALSMLTSTKSKGELKGLDSKMETEKGNLVSPQCSTARDLLNNEQGIDANTFVGFELRSRKKQPPQLMSTHSNLTKQGSEFNQLTGADQQSDKIGKETQPTGNSEKRKVESGVSRISRQMTQANISPSVRVLSESQMRPVYDLHGIMRWRNSSNAQNVDLLDQRNSQAFELQQKNTESPEIVEEVVRTTTLDYPSQLCFEGLQIQSQSASNNKNGSAAAFKTKTQTPTNFSFETNSYSVTTKANNRRLIDAIRRGQKQRRVAQQQSRIHIHNSVTSPVSSRADSNDANRNDIYIGDASSQGNLPSVNRRDLTKQTFRKSYPQTRDKLQQFVPRMSQMKVQAKKIEGPPEPIKTKSKAVGSPSNAIQISKINVKPLQIQTVSLEHGNYTEERENMQIALVAIMSETPPPIMHLDETAGTTERNNFQSPYRSNFNDTVQIGTEQDYAASLRNESEARAIMEELQQIQNFKSNFPAEKDSSSITELQINDDSLHPHSIEFQVLPSKVHKLVAVQHTKVPNRINLNMANNNNPSKQKITALNNRSLGKAVVISNFSQSYQHQQQQKQEPWSEQRLKSPSLVKMIKSKGEGGKQGSQSSTHVMQHFRVQGERCAVSSNIIEGGGLPEQLPGAQDQQLLHLQSRDLGAKPRMHPKQILLLQQNEVQSQSTTNIQIKKQASKTSVAAASQGEGGLQEELANFQNCEKPYQQRIQLKGDETPVIQYPQSEEQQSNGIGLN